MCNERDRIEAGLAALFAARDELIQQHNKHWYDKMASNRQRMKLDPLPYDPNKNYIPSAVRRDSMGVPI